MKQLVAIATYNEMENLPSLLEAILALEPEVDILVVDDNSPDGTGNYCTALAQKEPRFHCLIRKNERGLGSAVLEAFRFAVNNDYTYLVNMDADWSHPPEIVPKLIQAMKKSVDVAIASRYVAGGQIEGWPFYRKIMSRLINAWTRFCLGLKTKDCSGSFRCYRVEKLKNVLAGTIKSRGYSFFEEILFRIKQKQGGFTEIPYTFTDRRLGTSKINKKEAFRAVWTIFFIGFIQRHYYGSKN